MPIYLARALGNTALVVVCAAGAILAAGRAARGQSVRSLNGARAGVAAGGELDNYLRYLQTVGAVPPMPWSLRTFSAPVVDSLTAVRGAHPWRTAWLFARDSSRLRHFSVLPLEAAARFNSAFPFGSNDGPIWASRGLTTSLQGGAVFTWGPLSAVVDPIIFRAENRPFTLQPNGLTGTERFADGDFPVTIDRPQRFGDGAYSRFDWGQTTVRLDLFGLAAGFTTANQWWGPATTFPVILGSNAAGIPHVFIGTERPTNIWIGRVQARLVYGLERQSAYSPVVGPDTFASPDSAGRRRFMSGLVVTLTPAPIAGLELGAARFFHQAWFGHVGAAELRSPFEGILKGSLRQGYAIPGVDSRDALKNQLASVFARWVLPHSGFELYGEYGHEDHNFDTRDLLSEPDHSRIAMLGFRKVFRGASGERLSGIRGELIDGSAPTLARHRNEGLIYVHAVLRQGHTQDGQLLGADVGAGSPAGGILAWDRYSRAGRSTWYLQRVTEDNRYPLLTTATPAYTASHLFATVGFERVQFGKYADVTYRVDLTEGKRGAQMRRETNLNAIIQLSGHAW